MKKVKFHEPIGVFVIVQDPKTGKILLGKRKNAYKQGSWGFPGGRLEKTELLTTCAYRELLEETGLMGKSFQYVGVIRELQSNKKEKGYNFVHFTFLCNDYSGKVENKEPEKCEGWKWFSLDTLPDNILSGHKKGIEMYLNPQVKYIDLN